MRWKKTVCVSMAAVIWVSGAMTAGATISNIQSQKSQNEKELKNIQSQINKLESQKSALTSEINSLNDELMDTLFNIELLESDLADKEVQIEEAQIAYEEAKDTEERQYEAMKLRIQYMYESGNSSYMERLLSMESIADLVNLVDYAEEIQQYDNRLLDEYKAAKQAVIDLQNQLEEEKEELLEMEQELEEEKANLQSVISRKQTEVANFDSQLSSARAKANDYQKKIKEQTAQIKKLQEQAAKAAAAAAAQNTQTSSGGSTQTSGGSGSSSSSGSSGGGTVSSGGSGTGGAIASYGLQFVGRPYVAGGNSLTNGTDCSGFVHLVYAHFGISVPRQSGALAGGGRAVSASEMQPGDVVCYPNHVGIYIGNGQIVHASTAKTGIKISNVYYRTPTCIRRYW